MTIISCVLWSYSFLCVVSYGVVCYRFSYVYESLCVIAAASSPYVSSPTSVSRMYRECYVSYARLLLTLRMI